MAPRKNEQNKVERVSGIFQKLKKGLVSKPIASYLAANALGYLFIK